MLLIPPDTINLLRYLLVLRVNQPLVVLPPCLPVEMAYVLGTLITERLPTGRVKQWRKMQTAWEEANPIPGRRNQQKTRWPLTPPEVDWPLDIAWLPYTAKKSYGQDELVLCELKLFGESASHELFLELILPSLEQAGLQADGRWKRPRSLWGRFQMQGVYMARGRQWETVAEDGRLDFTYRPTPNQWADGLTFGQEMGISATRLDWLTPYEPLARRPQRGRSKSQNQQAKENAPTPADLLLALAARLDQVTPGWRERDGGETAVAQALSLAEEVGGPKTNQIKPPPKGWPGLVWGRQTCNALPPALLPHLELASILHIGRQTQYGCGTFRLS